MLARDLLDSRRIEDLPQPAVDPLTESQALLEAQVLEILFDVKRATLGVLFELRTSMMMTESNTGVLVAQGVQTLTFRGEPRDTKLTAWSVLTSEAVGASGASLELQFHPDAHIGLSASSLRYVNCDVASIGDIPPDYSDGFESPHRLLADWESEIHPISSSSTGR